jgi:hypothetical protein
MEAAGFIKTYREDPPYDTIVYRGGNIGLDWEQEKRKFYAESLKHFGCGRSTHEMTELELEAMIQRAAEAGAKKALRDVGLQDDDAVHDMREIRDLLDSWRSAKRTAANTIIKAFTYVFLGALITGSYFSFFNKP